MKRILLAMAISLGLIVLYSMSVVIYKEEDIGDLVLLVDADR